MAMQMRYAQSKVANGLFTYELVERLKAHNIKILSVIADPGVATTGIINTLDGEAQQELGWGFKIFRRAMRFFINNFSSAQAASDGAMPLTAAAFSSEARPGDFYAPENISKGLPKKVIAEGKSTWRFSKEGTILDKVAAKALWDISEEAVGVKFL